MKQIKEKQQYSIMINKIKLTNHLFDKFLLNYCKKALDDVSN